MNITEALTQIEANFPEAAKAIREHIADLDQKNGDLKIDYAKLHDFKDTMPKALVSQYFFGGENMVDGYIRLLNFFIGYTSDDLKGLNVIFGVEE